MTRQAVVTGAASGIGRATALRLAADGYRVHLVDRDEQVLQATVAQVGGAPAGGVHHVDLADPQAVAAAFERLLAEHGAPWLLVNNAGVGEAATVPDTSPQTWERILAVNLSVPFHTCRAVLPAMLDASGGVIVNVASVAGLVGVPKRAAYCASKAGLVGLSRAIAADHAAPGHPLQRYLSRHRRHRVDR